MKRYFAARIIEPLDQRLRTRDARKIERGAGGRTDHRPVEPRSLSALRKKELVGYRGKNGGQHRLSILDQRDADTPILAARQIGTRPADRSDDPDELFAETHFVVGTFLRQPAIGRC